MNNRRLLTWQGINDKTLEICSIKQTDTRIEVSSEISGELEETTIRLRYNVILDSNWYVSEFEAKNISPGKSFAIHYFQPSPGRWTNEHNQAIPEFDNCIDIDIFPTPFTNSLPIKRDPLQIGHARDYYMLWVDLIEGVVRADRQHYVRRSENEYEFKSIDTGFTTNIQFTDDGFVSHYPQLFRLKHHSHDKAG